jgi:anti-anti-sigma factor
MEIKEEIKGDVVIFKLEGRLDATTCAQLEAKVTEIVDAKKHKLIFNLQNMDYLSSAGMRVLLSVTKKFKALNGKFIVSSPTDDVMEIIKMAGFNQILHIVSSEDKALQEIQS